MTDYSLDDRWQENRASWTFTPTQTFSLLLIVIAMVTVIIGYSVVHSSETVGFIFNVFNDFYANVSSELISIVITVLVLDRLNARRAMREQRDELIFLLGSEDNSTALTAARMLRHKRWLQDGSLKGARLVATNLQGADLVSANLEEANLRLANLSNASLSSVNLDAANLMGANLTNASLSFSNLRNADLTHSNLNGTKLWYTILAGAKFSNTQMDENTFLPDGTNWTPDTDMTRFTDPNHPDFWQPDRAKEND